MHVSVKDITLLATTKSNINAAMAIQFLFSMVNLCKAYFGGEFDENHVRKHFVLIYELLDGNDIDSGIETEILCAEVMDYGIPQFMEADVLKKFIFEGGIKADLTDLNKLKQLTTQATDVTSWRAPGIKYKKNEVYIDIVENVNVLLSNKGFSMKVVEENNNIF